MRYFETLISQPIQFGETFSYPVGSSGDSYFISLVEYQQKIYPDKLTLPPIPSKTNRPHVRVEYVRTDMLGHSIEGGALSFNITLSQAANIDTNVTLSLQYNKPTLPEELLKDEDFSQKSKPFDWNDMVDLAQPTDFVNETIVVTIPTGSTDGVATFTLNDDLIPSSKVRVVECKIDSVDNPDYMIHPQHNNGYMCWVDNDSFPKWEGKVELWTRSHKLTHLERIINPETSSITGFTFGWEPNADGTLSDISTLTSLQIDDIPVHELMLKPVDGEVAVDIENTTPVDLTTSQPYFRMITMIGRRE